MKRIQKNEKPPSTKLKENKKPKLVEAKKTKKSLEALGIQNIRLIHNSSLQQLVEKTKSKEVILLTDYNRTGELILKKNLKNCFTTKAKKQTSTTRKKQNS